MVSWEEVLDGIELDAIRSLPAREARGIAVQEKRKGGRGEEGGQRLGNERS